MTRAPDDPSPLPRRRRPARAAAVATAVALLAVACGGTDDAEPTADGAPADEAPSDAAGDGPAEGTSTDDATGDTGVVEVDQADNAPVDVRASGFDIWRTGVVPDGVPEPTVELERISSGGPPPDGIPPIDDPVFVPVDSVDFLADREPVLALEVDGDHRAYPMQIMIWHEIVNDTVGGVPVLVTYCPLCNSAVAYERTVDGQVFDFGTSGLLYNSSLVMYDRQTETLWAHFTGEAVVGELTGAEMTTLPLGIVAWSDWRDTHPDGIVLDRDTGFERDYGRNPYPGYDDVSEPPLLFDGEVDGRYAAMTRMVGVESDGDAVAVTLDRLRDERTVATTLGDDPIVVFWTSGTASGLDTADLASGFDVGATGVFTPEIDGQALTFAPTPDSADTFTDDQTGSTWDVFGHAIAGPLEGAELDARPHVDTFWFAWSAFQPDTAVVG